jgi:N-acetylmuramoyl-L-alanine amidase
MKRFLALSIVALLLAISSIVLAQASSHATLRIPSGDHPVAYVQQGGQSFFSVSDVLAPMGGTMIPESTGFKVTLNDVTAAFGPDSRFAVVRDDLIEMPLAPLIVNAKPFAPVQFFQGFFSRAIESDLTWEPATRLLTLRRLQQTVVPVQMAVTNLQGISKVVLTLSAPVEATIQKEENAYRIRFRGPIQPPFAEQTFDDPNVTKATFSAQDAVVQLSGPDVVGDDYRLENPFRIVIDFRKVAMPTPGVTPSLPGLKTLEPAGIRTIVIDPGHGGKEVGAVGPKGLMEKDVTLAVAQKLAAALGSKIGARVVLTREDDSIVSLDQRTAIANQYRADLFLSVHMNAAVGRGAKGSETYFLSLEASDELARRAAETENAVAASALPAGAGSDLKLILWDLAQQEYLQESSRLAQVIQEEMNKATGVENRGVKQAPFKVLIGATMPAALIEVGFITNPDEEEKLRTDGFQNMMVEALTRAVERYKIEYETRIGLTQPRTTPALAGGNLKGER